MKAIVLKHFFWCNRKKKYYILVSDTLEYFSSKRMALEYLSKYSTMITEQLRNFNACYTNVCATIQPFIFDLDSSDMYRLNQLKSTIDERMYFITCRYTGENDSFATKTVLNIINLLQDIIYISHSKLTKIQYTGLHSQLNNINATLDNIRKNIIDFKIPDTSSPIISSYKWIVTKAA